MPCPAGFGPGNLTRGSKGKKKGQTHVQKSWGEGGYAHSAGVAPTITVTQNLSTFIMYLMGGDGKWLASLGKQSRGGGVCSC